MEIIRAYKTELKPNNRQRTLFEQFAETRQFVFNIGLREWKRQYERGEKPSAYGLKKQFNAVKYDYFPHVTDTPYTVTEGAFVDLGNAFKHFFRRVKNGDKKAGYPKEKRHPGGFHLRDTRVERDRSRLTGTGWVVLKEKGYIPINPLKYGTYATISQRAGRWFISVPVYEEIPDPENNSILVIGVDFGIKTLAVCSDGTTFENPKPLRTVQHKLKCLQRELSRRRKGGANWCKTQRKIQRCHAHIANIRKHTLHQISHELVVNRRPAVIAIENLNVSGMAKNHCLAQAVLDCGFYELRRQLEYKAKHHGVEIVIVDRWFPSSKTCSSCGCIKDDLTLSNRTFVCADCGFELDRDLNAARNLAALVEPRNTRGLPGELECSEVLL